MLTTKIAVDPVHCNNNKIGYPYQFLLFNSNIGWRKAGFQILTTIDNN
jgi:hypothetical protein